MAISRSQMKRQLYEGGGISSLQQARDILESQALPGEFLAYINPQEARFLQYMGGAGIPINSSGIPSYFGGIGKAFKSVAKGITGAAKSAVGAVKDIVSSDIGKAALLAAGGYYLGGGAAFGGPGFSFGKLGTSLASPFSALKTGLLGTVEAGTGLYGGGLFSGLANKFSGAGISSLIPGKGTLLSAGLGFLGGAAAGGALTPQQIETGMQRNPTAVRAYLAQYYKNINPEATESEAEQYALEQTREYAAEGGRVGYGLGSLVRKVANDPKFSGIITSNPEFRNAIGYSPLGPMLAPLIQATPTPLTDNQMLFANYYGNVNPGKSVEEIEAFVRENAAYGGPMGEPRENQQGVKELDYRQEGGFVPVGIKEKADDVPAMLSKNEFVFTADAVRGAGNGDVEKGAQRLYNTMKTLENGGTV